MYEEEELFLPHPLGRIMPRVKSYFTFEEAVARCESLGYAVVPQDSIKTLSFHAAITDLETRYERTETILKSYEDRKEQAFLTQLKQQGIIKYSQRVETKPCVTFHSWKLNVLTQE